jgi:23S rRNA pseudouridine1911/1915/1917 synthase
VTTARQITTIVPPELAGKRLDQALAALLGDFSRARLQQWIREGRVTVNAARRRPRDPVYDGDRIEVKPHLEAQTEWAPEAIPLDLIYEDDDILVINKPVGLVMHPAAGNRAGTLLNALLNYAPELQNIPRAGIVHRLDKDTSGLLVVARTLRAQTRLVEQLQARAFEREYRAVVVGVMPAGGSVDAPIGRHPVHRKRMAVVASGKPAVTHYRVLERFRAHSLLSVRLETGRTHQIRVHMAHIKYPLLGDPVYGGRQRIPPACSPELQEAVRNFRRQALHAFRLGFDHPVSGAPVHWEQPEPEDMRALIALLREDRNYPAVGTDDTGARRQ